MDFFGARFLRKSRLAKQAGAPFRQKTLSLWRSRQRQLDTRLLDIEPLEPRRMLDCQRVAFVIGGFGGADFPPRVIQELERLGFQGYGNGLKSDWNNINEAASQDGGFVFNASFAPLPTSIPIDIPAPFDAIVPDFNLPIPTLPGLPDGIPAGLQFQVIDLGNPDSSATFVNQAAQILNGFSDDDTIVLIGHSLGGDTALKIAQATTTQIDLLALLDPVGFVSPNNISPLPPIAGQPINLGDIASPVLIPPNPLTVTIPQNSAGEIPGFFNFSSLTDTPVPSNVVYFYNRWQENGPFPVDFLPGRTIPSNATIDDQHAQNTKDFYYFPGEGDPLSALAILAPPPRNVDLNPFGTNTITIVTPDPPPPLPPIPDLHFDYPDITSPNPNFGKTNAQLHFDFPENKAIQDELIQIIDQIIPPLTPDEFESNDSLSSAAVLGSPPFVALKDLTIDSSTDVDYFRITANQTGKLIVNALFKDAVGDLDLQVRDSFDNVIASSSGTVDNERIVIPVVGQQVYYVRVSGFSGATNCYDLEIENFAAPIPEAPILHPDDDNGISNLDNVTDIESPRIFIQADLAGFNQGGAIPVLTSAQATAGQTPGAAVQVFVNGTAIGFADAVDPTNTLFQFTLTTTMLTGSIPVNGGFLDRVTAAVDIFDGQANVSGMPAPATGRTLLSTPINLRWVDTHGPQITGVTIPGSGFDLFNPKAPVHGAAGPSPTPLINALDIGIRDLPARGPVFTHPALAAPFAEVEPNNSIANTQDIDHFFNLAFDNDIGDATSNTSTAIPHATIQGTGDGSFDYYTFTVDATGTVIFDVDGGAVDTKLHLFDGAGNFIISADDSLVTEGAGGSTSAFDPFLSQTLAPGRYVIGVARFPSTGANGGISGTTLQAGDSYTLHISVPGHAIQLSPGLVELRGDRVGVVPITGIEFQPNPIGAGQPATGRIRLSFATALPDDRYTLTVFDSLTDPAGNKLDGESNASEPAGALSPFTFPSGNGVAGGNFVARFTVDSRPEIAVYSGNSVTVDLNGNGFFDLANTDATNRDTVFQFGGVSDQRFAGKFVPSPVAPPVSLFDVLAAYGRPTGPGSRYRFLIDYNGDGRVDDPKETIDSPVQANALAVAGDFDGDPTNGDEVALFDGTTWYILSNDLHTVKKQFSAFSQGYPLAGDFDGDGQVDLATYQNGTFNIVFGPSFSGPAKTINLSSPGILNRPVAADMDGDGITDLGLWIPYSGVGQGTGEFRFLMSNDLSGTVRVLGTVNTLDHAFSPTPIRFDQAYHFGDPAALPLVGNFDPPVAASATGNGATSQGTNVTGPVNSGSPSPSSSSISLSTQTSATPLYSQSQARSLIASLYHDILGRAPDPGGLNYYAQQLQTGGDRQTIAATLLSSPEHYGQVVDNLYSTYLHRAADAGGRVAWIDALLNGKSEDEVAVDFLLSAEYAANHSSNVDFIDSLYHDVLGRGADSAGEASYFSAIAAGTTRAQLVATFLSSTERYQHIVDQLYGQILHRSADPSGLQAYLAKLQSVQQTPRSLELTLIASNEYFNKIGGN